MNGKPGKKRSRKLPGRIPKWGIRLPIVERKMFSRIKRLDSGDIQEKMAAVSRATQTIVSKLDHQQEIVEKLVNQFKTNGGNSREEKIQALERAIRKADVLETKLIKLGMYYRLIDFYQTMLSAREEARYLSHYRRRKSNLGFWRTAVGAVLRQKKREWEIKERRESPMVMRRYALRLLNPPAPTGRKQGPKRLE